MKGADKRLNSMDSEFYICLGRFERRQAKRKYEDSLNEEGTGEKQEAEGTQGDPLSLPFTVI